MYARQFDRDGNPLADEVRLDQGDDNRPVDPQHPATIFARVLSNPPDRRF
jgi:hypothetical protein